MPIFCLFLAVAVLAGSLLRVWAKMSFGLSLLLGFGVFVLLHVLYLMFLYLASLTVDQKKPLEKQNAICRRGCARVIGLLCFYCGVRPHFTGLEKLPEERFLLVCNHRSMFDPLIVMDKLRRWNISFISKPSNLEIPVIGRIACAAGFLPIDRENDRKALKTILQAADYLKKGICSMAVYPEGTRSRTGEMLPFHAGCFKVAQRAGAPLVIAAVRDTEKVGKNILFKGTDVYMDILEVLPAEKVKAMSTGELSDYSRARIEAWLLEKNGGEAA